MTLILLQRGKNPIRMEADPVSLADLRAERRMDVFQVRFESGIPLGWAGYRAVFLTDRSRYCITGPRRELNTIQEFVGLARKYVFSPLIEWVYRPEQLERAVTWAHLIFVASEDIQQFEQRDMFAPLGRAALPSPAGLVWRPG